MDGIFWRAVLAQWQRTPLGTAGSKRVSGRYHRAPDPTLYFCERPEAAVAEVHMFTISRPYSLFPVKVKLSHVLDLTNPSIIDETRVDPLMLRQIPWEIFNDIFQTDSYSQLIAKIARISLYEGIVVESAAAKGHKNLVVFTDNLRKKSVLKLELKDLDENLLKIAAEDQSIVGKLMDV